MLDFYCIELLEKRGTPYAPTIVSEQDLFLANCIECGRTHFNDANRDLSLIIEGKRKLPDTLMCGHIPLTIVTSNVIEAWEKHNITGYTSFPIKQLLDLKRNPIQTEVQYYCVNINGYIELDFEKMGVQIIEICSMCGPNVYSKNIREWGTAYFKEHTYDGSDLFVPKYFEGVTLCTKRVLKIIYEEKLTNFDFRHYKYMFGWKIDAPEVNLKELFSK